jgi:hypothetical protein
LNESGNGVAAFSSRGMTTWNLKESYGIIKPDILTLGKSVVLSNFLFQDWS